MNRLILLSVVLAIGLTGCFQRHPLPYEYEGWERQGTPYFRTEEQKKLDEIEIQKALLECGYESPFGDSTNDMNKAALLGRCMEKAGFEDISYQNVSKNKTFCQDYPTLPACNLPLSQIPDRNISMRLNSKWCAKYPQADACKP